jgi:hypothetical protein
MTPMEYKPGYFWLHRALQGEKIVWVCPDDPEDPAQWLEGTVKYSFCAGFLLGPDSLNPCECEPDEFVEKLLAHWDDNPKLDIDSLPYF